MKKLYSGAEKLGLNLTPEQVNQFEVYYHELVEWNKRVNLTSVTGYEEVQITHFLDSLTVISGFRSPQPDKQLRIIDVGTGAGFPGIPLRIVLPEIRLVLLEATAKKTEFLRHITAELELDNVEIVRDRAEDAAIGHIVRVQDFQRIAHRCVFVERVRSFEDFIEMVQARLIVAQVFPDSQRQFIPCLVLPLVKLPEAHQIGRIRDVIAGQTDERYTGGR